MKKVYLSLFIIAILSISLVAAASTGWSILDVFKGKQAKEAPSDDLMIVQHVTADQASCNAQIAQNRQLLLSIIDHLGIQGVESITGQPIRNVARNTRARDARSMRATARQRTIERAPIRQVRRPDVIERAPATPIQIQRGPSEYGEKYEDDEGQLTQLMIECLEGPPPYILDGDMVVENNFENCFEWIKDLYPNNSYIDWICADGCASTCYDLYELPPRELVDVDEEDIYDHVDCRDLCEEVFC